MSWGGKIGRQRRFVEPLGGQPPLVLWVQRLPARYTHEWRSSKAQQPLACPVAVIDQVRAGWYRSRAASSATLGTGIDDQLAGAVRPTAGSHACPS